MGVLPDVLSQLFSREEGMTLSEYISRERIRIASRELIFTQRPIDEIAASLCFSSQSHFAQNTYVTLHQNAEKNKQGRLVSSGTAIDVTLAPRTTYYVSVSVTGENGDSACAQGSFDTGKMNEPWQAQWIGMPEDCEFHPILSKSFAAKQDVNGCTLPALACMKHPSMVRRWAMISLLQ